MEQVGSLRKDRSAEKYPSHTNHSAPHKPLLLLAVFDLFAEGIVDQNQIRLTPELCDLFSGYWRVVMPEHRRGDIAMPFYHLRSEGFWHLIPRPESVSVLRGGRRLRSIRLLHDHTKGARLDDELYTLLQDEENRRLLQVAVIETHFTSAIQERLREHGKINVEAYRYSQQLLQWVHETGEFSFQPTSEEIPRAVRDRGFRRTVTDAYDHRCAVSGIRILTADYHTAVEAAHIVPWSVSQNDDPRNGISLSKLCHWAFEEGLLTITTDYIIKLSGELSAHYNAPGYLGTLDQRPIHLPDEEKLRPDLDALKWHRKHRFRR
jgi:putative restriction endonuclease